MANDTSFLHLNSTTNHSGFDDYSFTELKQSFKTFLAICVSVIIVIATLGNSAVLIGFIAYKKLRTNTNFFIVSLGVSDIIHALVVMPFEVEYFHESWTGWKHGLVVCEFNNTMYFVALSSSMLSLLCVSFYRYITIAYPFYAEKLRRRHILVMISAIWIYCVLTSSLPVMGWRTVPTVIDDGECLFDFADEFFMFFYICNFFLPSFFMLVMYSMIFFIARRHAKEIEKLEMRFSKIEDHDGNQLATIRNNRRPKKRHLKAARTMGKIFLVYFFCWMPYALLLFTYMLCLQCRFNIPRYLHNIFTLLAYSNSAINPFLFAAWCHDFRALLRHVLRHGTDARNSNLSVPNTFTSSASSR